MPRRPTKPPPDLDRAHGLMGEAWGKIVLGERLWLHPNFPKAAAEAEACLEEALAIVKAWRKEHGR